MRNEFTKTTQSLKHTKLLEVKCFICDVLSEITFVNKCFEYYLIKYPASATLTIT